MVSPTITSNRQDFLWPVRERIQHLIERAHGELRQAVDYLFASEGKLLRPTLVWLCAEAYHDYSPQHRTIVGNLDKDAIVDFAAAAEMIHVASLVHDDVIDEALTRRNAVSLNVRFSNHTAVLAGDFLFASAFELLSKHASKGVISLMTDAIARMCHGEIHQKVALYDPGTTEQGYFDRIEGKTAALIAACCEGGARLAGADDETARRFRRYGHKLGLAFQIVDDILDLDGDPDELGKPTGQDLRQGVITLPVIRLLAHSDYYEVLAPSLISRCVDDHCLTAVKTAARAVGAVDSARKTAAQLIHEALEEIKPYCVTPAGLTLKELGNQVIARTH